MAGLNLLDGISAAFDMQTDVQSADLTAANTSAGTIPAATSTNFDSWKCVAEYMWMQITQEFLQRVTFCSNRWRGRIPGVRDLLAHADCFMSKGTRVSDPMYLFATTKGIPWIGTFDTGCTASALIMAASDRVGTRAFANSERGVDLAADGSFISPATTWVTT